MGKDSVSGNGELISEIETTIERDPIAAAKLCRSVLKDADEGYRKELYQILAFIYRLANVFRSEKAAWRDFCKEEFWEKCEQRKPNSNTDDDIMLWVSRFVFRAAQTKGTRYNRAYKHARTLQRYSREKVPESAVAEKLAEEGADYVFRMEVAEHPRRRTAAGDHDTGAGADENRAGSRGGGGGSVRKDRSDRASEKLDVPILEVEMTEERLQRVLRLAVGEKARVTVERIESANAWKRIVGTSVKVLD